VDTLGASRDKLKRGEGVNESAGCVLGNWRRDINGVFDGRVWKWKWKWKPGVWREIGVGWDRGREEGANLLSEHPDIT
jgi:hypothetical protein